MKYPSTWIEDFRKWVRSCVPALGRYCEPKKAFRAGYRAGCRFAQGRLLYAEEGHKKWFEHSIELQKKIEWLEGDAAYHRCENESLLTRIKQLEETQCNLS